MSLVHYYYYIIKEKPYIYTHTFNIITISIYLLVIINVANATHVLILYFDHHY